MAGVERMNAADKMHIVTSVRVIGANRLRVAWSNGIEAELDMSTTVHDLAFAALNDPAEFDGVQIGDWGHSLVWPCGAELGADALWLDTLTATGHANARIFLEWRLRHGLSLTKAADALGLSRRMVAYYSSGEKPIPKPILLACKGWEVSMDGARAA
jgi:Protein of unknown function (DUF2442)